MQSKAGNIAIQTEEYGHAGRIEIAFPDIADQPLRHGARGKHLLIQPLAVAAGDDVPRGNLPAVGKRDARGFFVVEKDLLDSAVQNQAGRGCFYLPAEPVDKSSGPAVRRRLHVSRVCPADRHDDTHELFFAAEYPSHAVRMKVPVYAFFRGHPQVAPYRDRPTDHFESYPHCFRRGHGLVDPHAYVEFVEMSADAQAVLEEAGDPRPVSGIVPDQLIAQFIRLAGENIVEGPAFVPPDALHALADGVVRSDMPEHPVDQAAFVALVEPLDR